MPLFVAGSLKNPWLAIKMIDFVAESQMYFIYLHDVILSAVEGREKLHMLCSINSKSWLDDVMGSAKSPPGALSELCQGY